MRQKVEGRWVCTFKNPSVAKIITPTEIATAWKILTKVRNPLVGWVARSCRRWLSPEEGDPIFPRVAFVDLAKAFDAVSHSLIARGPERHGSHRSRDCS